MQSNEVDSLKGHVAAHPLFTTPYDTPTFLRSAMLRVIAGMMLLSACLALSTSVVVDDPVHRFSCALAFATCIVAFYHYTKLIAIREQTGVRIKLTPPGDPPSGQPMELKLAWQELNADAVRYSDWAVTLLPLLIDLHLSAYGKDARISTFWSVVPVQLMVAFGAFTRLGTDELVPRRNGGGMDATMLLGLHALVISFACLAVVLYTLLEGLSNGDESNGWVYAFSLPWVLYGVVAVGAIVWRQVQPGGYPEALSITKDIAYGILDVWSKAVFSMWVCARALGLQAVLFSL